MPPVVPFESFGLLATSKPPMKPGSRDFFVILSLWMLVFASSSQIMIVAPILSQIGTALDIPEALRGTLITAYAVMIGLFALIVGPISDKFGRRRVLLIGSGCLAATLVGHLFVVDYFTILTARAVAGASAGFLSGAAVSYVGDYFPYNRRGWANGWVMSGIAFGQIAGIPLGILLADQWGFRAPFVAFGILMTAAFLLILFTVTQPTGATSKEPLSLGGALSRYGSFLRRADTRNSAFTYLLLFFGVSLFIVYFPSWLEESIGMNRTEISVLFFVGGIASVIVGPQAGKLSDRFGRKPIIIGSCIALAIAMALTTVVVSNRYVAYALFMAAMAFVAARISPLQALLSALVGSEGRGTLMSLAVAVGQVGMAIGGVVAGLLYTEFGYGADTLAAALSMVLAAIVLGWLVPEPEGDLDDTVPALAAEGSDGAIAG